MAVMMLGHRSASPAGGRCAPHGDEETITNEIEHSHLRSAIFPSVNARFCGDVTIGGGTYPVMEPRCQRRLPDGQQCSHNVAAKRKFYCEDCAEKAKPSTANWRQQWRKVQELADETNWDSNETDLVTPPDRVEIQQTWFVLYNQYSRDSERFDFYEEMLQKSLLDLKSTGPQDESTRKRSRLIAQAILKLFRDTETVRSTTAKSIQLTASRLLIATGFEGPPTKQARRTLLKCALDAIRTAADLEDFPRLGNALLDTAQVYKLFECNAEAFDYANAGYLCFAEKCRLPSSRPSDERGREIVARGRYEARQLRNRLHFTQAKSRLRRFDPAKASEELRRDAETVGELGDQSAAAQARREAVGYFTSLKGRVETDTARKNCEEMWQLESNISSVYYKNTFLRAEIELLLAEGDTVRAANLIMNDYFARYGGHAHYYRLLATWNRALHLGLPLPPASEAIRYGSPALIFNL